MAKNAADSNTLRTMENCNVGNFGQTKLRAPSHGSFPLTPALSPGERENRPPVLEHSEALAGSLALVPEPPERGDEAKRVTVSQRSKERLPLPWYVFSGGFRRAATKPPAFSGRNERSDVAGSWKRCAAELDTTRRSATSSTTLNAYLPRGEGWGEGERSKRTFCGRYRSAFPIVILIPLLLFSIAFSSRAAQAEIKDLSVNGGVQDGKARLVFEANLQGLTGDKDKLLCPTTLQHSLQISRDKHTHTIAATFDILQGEAKELPLTITGDGDIKKVTGDNLQDWSVRQETNGTRSLVLRPRKTDKPPTQLAVNIVAERELRGWSNPVQPLAFAPPHPALFSGYLKVEVAPELEAQPTNSSGLVPIETKFLPETLRGKLNPEEAEPLAFRFHGSAYALPLLVTIGDPESRRVVLREFQLVGHLTDQSASFTLTAVARVRNPRGGSLSLLSGGAALADLERSADWRLNFQNGQFVLVFDRPGDFPLRLKFNAAGRQSAGWSGVDFRVTPGVLAPVTFQGLAADTQFEFAGAARPDRSGSEFKSFLPPDGAMKLSWKTARPEVEGKLFYAVEMLAQISISPGLMRQLALIAGKVMQGELSRVALVVRGPGNVTAVQGANLLAWNVEPV